MKSLEERQKEWDEKYSNPEVESLDKNQPPARPSKEEDEKTEKIMSALAQTPWNLSDKKEQDNQANQPNLQKKKPISREEEMFISRSDGGKLNYFLTILTHQEINLELKKSILDRSISIVSLSKETSYGIARIDRSISHREIDNDRLASIIEQGLSDFYKEEKKLYESRREFIPPDNFRPDYFRR